MAPDPINTQSGTARPTRPPQFLAFEGFLHSYPTKKQLEIKISEKQNKTVEAELLRK